MLKQRAVLWFLIAVWLWNGLAAAQPPELDQKTVPPPQQPEAPEEVAHWRAGVGVGNQLVVLFGEHGACPSWVEMSLAVV